MGIAISDNAAERELARMKNVGDYFLRYSQAVRPWLKELAERYKARGEFPMIPMVVLPSYYDSIQDKEIALFAGLLIKEDAEFEQIREFRELLGEKPWEWFRNREFVRLGIGRVQDKRTGGVLNWKIAKLMDRLWEHIRNSPEDILLYGIKPKFKYLAIETLVERASKGSHFSYFDVLTVLCEDCGVGEYFYKLRLLLLIAGTSDGFGLGLWEKPQERLLCPLTHDLRTFLSTWFPDYKRCGGSDDAIRLFGFERDCDFFYAYLAYRELQKRNPKVCSEFATTYLRWYSLGARKKPFQFREILPEIEI